MILFRSSASASAVEPTGEGATREGAENEVAQPAAALRRCTLLIEAHVQRLAAAATAKRCRSLRARPGRNQTGLINRDASHSAAKSAALFCCFRDPGSAQASPSNIEWLCRHS